MKRILCSGCLLLALGVVLGCGGTRYYVVKDPGTNKTYYTEKINKDGSALTLTDAKSGAIVTIQNSEVTELSQQSYQQGLAVATAAPAPTAAAPEPAK